MALVETAGTEAVMLLEPESSGSHVTRGRHRSVTETGVFVSDLAIYDPGTSSDA